MTHTITRFLPNPATLTAYATLAAGLVAGLGLGLAVALQVEATPSAAPVPEAPAYVAPDVCMLPPVDPDGVGFLVLLDEAEHRPSTNV